MTKKLLLALPIPVLVWAAVSTPAGLPAPGSIIAPLLVVLLLVGVNGLFVAAEFALIGVRPTQLEQLVNGGNSMAQYMLNVLRQPEAQKHYIATAQVGISLASLGLGMYGELKLSEFAEPYLARLLGVEAHTTFIGSLGYVGAVGLLTYLHIVVGEMVPKTVALSAPDRAALAISPFMRLMQTVFNIPVRLLNGIGAAILWLIRIPPAEGHARLHSPEELELIVSASAEGGLLSEAEEETITKIFNFAERQVHQVMTPRPKIEAISHNMPLPNLFKRVCDSPHSRFPVYENDIDHIIGVLHLKDLVCRRHMKNLDIRLLLRPAPVVPERYPVQQLLTAMRRQRLHMAVVLDEYGGTAGLVTLEDLIEEVVGEVRDEFDRELEPIVEIAPGVLEVAGNVQIDDLWAYLELDADEPHRDVDTVGGLMMARLGRLPYVGDTVTCSNGVRLTALAMDGRALARAKVEYPTD